MLSAPLEPKYYNEVALEQFKQVLCSKSGEILIPDQVIMRNVMV